MDEREDFGMEQSTIPETEHVREQPIDYYEDYNQCKYCHTNRIDKSENPDSVLCKDCREKLIKYPVPIKIYVALLAILILVVVGFLSFPTKMKEYIVYEKAEELAENGYPFSALQSLNELAEKYPESTNISLKMLEIGMKSGYYDYAGYTIDTYLAGKELADADYYKAESYSTQLEKYYNSYNAFSLILQEEEAMSENAQAYIEAELTTLLSEPDQYRPLLYYYLGYVSDTQEKQIEYLEKAYSLDATLSEAAAELGIIYRRMGNMELAKQYSNEAYNTDKENSTAIRGLAILKLLEGEKEYALELAQNAYEVNPEANYVIDTYIVALQENNQSEKANQIKAEWTQQGYQFDADLDAFLTGTISLQDYYISE